MKTSETDKNIWFRKICSCAVVTAGLFLGAYLWDTKISRPATSATTAKNISATLPEKSKYKHTRIADIKVGERVVTSSDDTSKPTAVDPATWKKVMLYAEETWYDGTLDSINVVTLVPPEWLALYDAKVGSMVPIPLDLQEMGLDENLLAKIQAIEECPEIRAGPGRVVLTTVNHLSRGVCSLTYTSQDGKSETIRPTSSHRFYSLDREEWIHIGEARTGEKLQGLGSGIIEVVACQPLGTTERVYNMTVEDEHVYHVGLLNLLTHNTGCSPTLPVSSSIPFWRGSRVFYLEQGNSQTGWTHIYERHIDRSQNLDATKFPSNWSEGDIFKAIRTTIDKGTVGNFYNLVTYEKTIAMKGLGSRTFRVTINTDGTIRSFHMLEP